MPAYCAPPPGNMNTTSGLSPRSLWVNTRRVSVPSSKGGGLVVAGGDQHAPVLEGAAPFFQREGDVGQRLLGVGAQVGGQRLGIRIERRA